MKLLVVSHPCVIPHNQKLYSTVQKLTGWQVSIVVPSTWVDEYGKTREPVKLPEFEGQLIPVPVRRPGNIILHTYRASFKTIIHDLDPDAIYVHQEPYGASTAQVYWGNWRARKSDHAKRCIGFYSAQNIYKRQPPPFGWTEQWVLRTSDFAFPCSSTSKEVLIRKHFRGEGVVLPLPVDPAIHHRADASSTRRELLGEESDDTVLMGYVGRFVPEKGIQTLIKAASQLLDLKWKLIFTGSGSSEAELRQQAAASGIANRVRFNEFVPHEQIAKTLSAIDVLVLPSETQPSWREQFGRVLLEAMACGTPVVGTDCGEVPVLIRDTGGGLIVRERDPADLANALRKMIVDPALRSRMSQAGEQAVVSRYTVADAAARFAGEIERLTNQPAGLLKPILS